MSVSCSTCYSSGLIPRTLSSCMLNSLNRRQLTDFAKSELCLVGGEIPTTTHPVKGRAPQSKLPNATYLAQGGRAPQRSETLQARQAPQEECGPSTRLFAPFLASLLQEFVQTSTTRHKARQVFPILIMASLWRSSRSCHRVSMARKSGCSNAVGPRNASLKRQGVPSCQ